MLQLSHPMPLFVTGYWQMPHGYTELGPGFVCMSPESSILNSARAVFLLVCLRFLESCRLWKVKAEFTLSGFLVSFGVACCARTILWVKHASTRTISIPFNMLAC